MTTDINIGSGMPNKKVVQSILTLSTSILTTEYKIKYIAVRFPAFSFLVFNR